jgi:hypothetical protein
MSFSRKRQPNTYTYQLNNKPIARGINMKALRVTFDCRLTFHEHIVIVAKESFGRLGFLLRTSRDFYNLNVINVLFAVFVRSKLKTAMCVWNPYKSKYKFLLEKVQKYLYKRIYGY